MVMAKNGVKAERQMMRARKEALRQVQEENAKLAAEQDVRLILIRGVACSLSCEITHSFPTATIFS